MSTLLPGPPHIASIYLDKKSTSIRLRWAGSYEYGPSLSQLWKGMSYEFSGFSRNGIWSVCPRQYTSIYVQVPSLCNQYSVTRKWLLLMASGWSRSRGILHTGNGHSSKCSGSSSCCREFCFSSSSFFVKLTTSFGRSPIST